MDGYFDKLIPMVCEYFPEKEDWESAECRDWFIQIHLEQLSKKEMEAINYFKSNVMFVILMAMLKDNISSKEDNTSTAGLGTSAVLQWFIHGAVR